MHFQAIASGALSIATWSAQRVDTIDMMDAVVSSTSRIAKCEGDDRGPRTCNQDATHRVCAKIKNDRGFFESTGQAGFDWSDRIGERCAASSRSGSLSLRLPHSPSLALPRLPAVIGAFASGPLQSGSKRSGAMPSTLHAMRQMCVISSCRTRTTTLTSSPRTTALRRNAPRSGLRARR